MAGNETLASSCVTKICSLILNGELQPGERIKGEYLKSQLEVGLSPIREALSRLVATGLVDIIDNVGFRVAQITRFSVYDNYKSYAKIDSLLFREAIESGDEEWEAAIIAALYRLAKIEKAGVKANYQIWQAQNEDFHGALIKACNLNALTRVRENFTLIKKWYQNLAHRNFSDKLIVVNHLEHSKIAELAIARKVDAACMMLYQHSMNSLNPLILKLKQNGYLID